MKVWTAANAKPSNAADTAIVVGVAGGTAAARLSSPGIGSSWTDARLVDPGGYVERERVVDLVAYVRLDVQECS